MIKRTIMAAILLLVVAAVIVYSGISLDGAIKQLDHLLAAARSPAAAQDFEEAEYYIKQFQAALEDYEPLFILFSQRDMFYSIKYTASAMSSYNNSETYLDMLAELDRTRSDLSILWKSTFRLI